MDITSCVRRATTGYTRQVILKIIDNLYSEVWVDMNESDMGDASLTQVTVLLLGNP